MEKNDPPIRMGIDDIHAFENAFGLPKGFIDSLQNDNDWSLIVKSHALIESASSNLLTHYFGKKELGDLFSQLEMSNKKYGKAAFISALRLLDKKERAFISILSELRNVVAHDISNVNISLVDYLQSLSPDKRKSYLKTLNIWLTSITVNGIDYKGDDLILRFPKQVLWSSLKYCLFQIWLKSVYAIERNKEIGSILHEVNYSGPIKVDLRTPLTILSSE